MRKKILAVNYDIGGANAIVNPLSSIKNEDKVDLSIVSEGPSQDVYASREIPYKNLSHYGINQLKIDSFDKIFKEEKPDLLVTGTSGSSNLERYAINSSKKFSRPSLSVLDFYGNYSFVFSDNETGEKLRFMPSYIAVMDEIALEEMVKEGFDKDKLIITGQPAFDDLIDLRKNFSVKKGHDIRDNLGISLDSYLITFISQYFEHIKQEAAKGRWPGFVPPYTEVTVLRSLYNALKELKIINVALLVKLHRDPREFEENTRKAIIDILPEHKIIFLRDRNTRNHILASDLVTGMNSTSLQEAVYLDKDVVSIQPGLVPPDKILVTNNVGLSIPIYKEEGIKPTLEKIIYDVGLKKEMKKRRSKVLLEEKATENVKNLIYKLLNI